MSRLKIFGMGVGFTLLAVALALAPGLTDGRNLFEALSIQRSEATRSAINMGILTLFITFVVPEVEVREDGRNRLIAFSVISAVVLLAGLILFTRALI